MVELDDAEKRKMQTEGYYLMKMVRNWRRDYQRHLVPFGDNRWVFDDFLEEVSMHLEPYLTRLQETGYLSKTGRSVMAGYIANEVEYLYHVLNQMEERLCPPIELWR